MEITPNEQFITTNLDKIFSFIDKVFEGYMNANGQLDHGEMRKLFEEYASRFGTAPASPRSDYYSAMPGGLCYHTLNIIHWMNKFTTLMIQPDKQFSKQTILTVSLLAEFGKIGDEKHDYFLPLTDDWHNSKGIYYETNPKLTFMRPSHRSLYFANNYGIVLTEEEFLAILLQDDDESTAIYKHKEPHLAIVLRQAINWARTMERQNKINWPV